MANTEDPSPNILNKQDRIKFRKAIKLRDEIEKCDEAMAQLQEEHSLRNNSTDVHRENKPYKREYDKLMNRRKKLKPKFDKICGEIDWKGMPPCKERTDMKQMAKDVKEDRTNAPGKTKAQRPIQEIIKNDSR